MSLNSAMVTGIRELSPDDQSAVHAVARLHCELLPRSPAALLGHEFLESFYYRSLVEDRLVWCNTFYYDGVLAGFIACTHSASDFMTQGLRSHWLELARVLVNSIVRNPRRLKVIAGVAQMMRKRNRQSPSTCNSEILSLGVLPEFRGSDFLRRTGRRIPLELFDSAREFFRQKKCAAFRMLVESHNREALFFYRALGCEFKKPQEEAASIEVIYRFDREEEAVAT